MGKQLILRSESPAVLGLGCCRHWGPRAWGPSDQGPGKTLKAPLSREDPGRGTQSWPSRAESRNRDLPFGDSVKLSESATRRLGPHPPAGRNPRVSRWPAPDVVTVGGQPVNFPNPTCKAKGQTKGWTFKYIFWLYIACTVNTGKYQDSSSHFKFKPSTVTAECPIVADFRRLKTSEREIANWVLKGPSNYVESIKLVVGTTSVPAAECQWRPSLSTVTVRSHCGSCAQLEAPSLSQTSVLSSSASRSLQPFCSGCFWVNVY